MDLTSKDKKKLRALANPLKPEVWIGKSGLTEGIVETTGNSLQTKELVKIKVLDSCEMEREAVAQKLSDKLDAQILQILGNIILLYKKLPDKNK